LLTDNRPENIERKIARLPNQKNSTVNIDYMKKKMKTQIS